MRPSRLRSPDDGEGRRRTEKDDGDGHTGKGHGHRVGKDRQRGGGQGQEEEEGREERGEEGCRRRLEKGAVRPVAYRCGGERHCDHVGRSRAANRGSECVVGSGRAGASRLRGRGAGRSVRWVRGRRAREDRCQGARRHRLPVPLVREPLRDPDLSGISIWEFRHTEWRPTGAPDRVSGRSIVVLPG